MRIKLLATSCYILFIIILNCLMTKLPHVAAFGESFSPADMLLGIIYIVRDFAQREIKHYVIIAMLVGGLISYVFADKTIAVASVAAFFVGETIDWLIYTFTKRPLSKRLLWSATLSSPVDSFVFLYFVQRLFLLPLLMMTFAKVLGVFLLWGSWKLRERKLNFERS